MGFRIESDQFSFLLKADILLCLSTLIGVIFFCGICHFLIKIPKRMVLVSFILIIGSGFGCRLFILSPTVCQPAILCFYRN